jgi:hypothetical protein
MLAPDIRTSATPESSAIAPSDLLARHPPAQANLPRRRFYACLYMDIISNRTFGEIMVGNAASLTRTISPTDIEALASGELAPPPPASK